MYFVVEAYSMKHSVRTARIFRSETWGSECGRRERMTTPEMRTRSKRNEDVRAMMSLEGADVDAVSQRSLQEDKNQRQKLGGPPHVEKSSSTGWKRGP